MKYKLILAAAVLLFLLMAAGCGTQTKTVFIQDARCRTEVTVPVNADVRGILAAAEITVGEKDRLSAPQDEVPSQNSVIDISRWAKATVVTENGEKEVELCGGTVADALKECGVTLNENDVVNYDTAAYVSDIRGDIVVTRLFSVTLTADGKTKTFLSPKATVREILDDQKCELGELDRVLPAIDSAVSADTEIVVQRVVKETLKKTVSIPYSTEKEYSSSLADGKKETKRAGVNGSKEITYEITYVDGAETAREAVSERTITQPVSAIVVYGTRKSGGGQSGGKTVVSRVRVEDCDGSGHGYYIITYSDGSESYEYF